MVVRPGVKVKAVEGDPGLSHGDLDQEGPDIALEQGGAHAEVGHGLLGAQEAGEKHRGGHQLASAGKTCEAAMRSSTSPL